MNVSDFIREICISFIVGTVPCLLSGLSGGYEGLTAFIQAIDTSHPTVSYFIAIFLIQITVSIIGRYRASYLEGVQQRFAYIFAIVNGAGASLLSLYRLITGVAIAILIVASRSYAEAGLGLIMMSIVAIVTFLTASCMFSRAGEYAVSLQQISRP